MPSRRSVVVLATLALLGGACSDAPAADPTPTPTATESATPTPPPTPTPTVSETPSQEAVGLSLSEAETIVNEIYAEFGAITRKILAEPPDPAATVLAEDRERLFTILAGQYRERRLDDLETYVREGGDKVRPAAEYGQLRFEARAFTASSASCTVVVGDYIVDETAVEPGRELVALSLSPAADSLTPIIQ